MKANESAETTKLEDRPETFQDLARICLKKTSKGPFDQLISTLYRLQHLTQFLPTLDPSLPRKEKFQELLHKGLKLRSYKAFREEFQNHEVLYFLKDMPRPKSFFEAIMKVEKTEKTNFEKAFLMVLSQVLPEHTIELQYLKSIVDSQIIDLEDQLKNPKSQN